MKKMIRDLFVTNNVFFVRREKILKLEKTVKRFFMIVLVFVLTVMITGLNFAVSSSIRASFSVIANPKINMFSIQKHGGVDTVRSLTPGLKYDILFEVEDLDGIGSNNGGVERLEVKLWYDETAVKADEADFKAQDNPRPEEYVSITWDRELNIAMLDDGTDESEKQWELVESRLPTFDDLEDENYTRHTFIFTVKIAEVARHSTDSYDERWQVAARVQETAGSSDYYAFEYHGEYGVDIQEYVILHTINVKDDSYYNYFNKLFRWTSS